MIDLNEPVRKSYSSVEKDEIKKSFNLLLHSLLLLYLALHNLIIPAVINLFKDQSLYIDIHYWFLFHLPIFIWLWTKKEIHPGYLLFLVSGSLSRLIYYSIFNFDHSWTLLSVYLSELSSLIFCFIIWRGSPQFIKGLLSLVLGILTPILFARIEVTPVVSGRIKVNKSVTHDDLKSLGCRGAELHLNLSEKVIPALSPKGAIKECGFEFSSLWINNSFELMNETNMDINLRLYKLTRKKGRFTWKFVRIKRVKQGQGLKLDSYLKDQTIYMLKSPERRKLGMLLLLSSETTLTGIFDFTFDDLHWRAQ